VVSYLVLMLRFQQACILPDSGKCIFFSKGCQCLKVPGLSRYACSLTTPVLIPVLTCLGKAPESKHYSR